MNVIRKFIMIGSQVQTCKIFGCSERSLMRWVDKYKSTNNITRKKRDYKAYKITNSHISFIKQQLKQNKTITIDQLLVKLKTKYPNLTLSRVHLGRVVRDINITLKQTRLRHVPKTRYKKPIVIKNQIKEFYSKVKQYNLDDIICIDETSLNSFMIRRKCYEELGKRCVVKTESQEVFKKYTGIFAISSKGVIGYEIYKKGGIDSNRMVNFIDKFINGKYKNKLIILDNASSHRNQLVKDVIKKDNKLLYTVPYQHYTNAIEGYFNVLKSRLQKKKGLTYNELVNNVKDVLDEIPIYIYKNLIKGAYDRNEIYDVTIELKKSLIAKYGKESTNLGDEGGFVPCGIQTNDQALTLLENSIKNAGLTPNKDVFVALDCAATEFYNQETKLYEIEDDLFLHGKDL